MSLNDDYSAAITQLQLATHAISEHSTDGDTIYNLIQEELLLDGNARQNLATFCQTWLEKNIHQIMDDSIDKNMIDKDEYPMTAEIEKRCVEMIARLWHSPEPDKTAGCSTTGSSEAAMLCGLAMKFNWRKKREALGLDSHKPNIVTGPVQVCWHKFARYFDVELREVSITEHQLGLTGEILSQYVDENTIGVVATLGVTFTCHYEPIEELCQHLDKIHADYGWDIPLHVDGASGGFIAPFVTEDLRWDFRLNRVKSINASGHKFGLAPLGVGWAIWREWQDMPEDMIFWVNYLGGNMPTFALNFSRPAGQIISQYYLFNHLGKQGYRNILTNLYTIAQYIGQKIISLNDFEIFFNADPYKGIPAISWTQKSSVDHYSLYDLSDRLRMNGWQVAAYSMPADMEEIVVMRLVLRHGFSINMADLLMKDIERCLLYFQKNPKPLSTQTHDETSKFSHSGR